MFRKVAYGDMVRAGMHGVLHRSFQRYVSSAAAQHVVMVVLTLHADKMPKHAGSWEISRLQHMVSRPKNSC